MSLKYTGESTEGLPLSDAVVAGDFVFVSGICGFDQAQLYPEVLVRKQDKYLLFLQVFSRKSGPVTPI